MGRLCGVSCGPCLICVPWLQPVLVALVGEREECTGGICYFEGGGKGA